MKKINKYKKLLNAVRDYLVFFLFMAFIITCCIQLFLHILSISINITYTKSNIRQAAILTFINVLILSFIFTVIDIIRRKITVERPVKNIIKSAEKIMKGDFSVRIEQQYGINSDNGFALIINYFNRMAEELSGLETLRMDFISNVSHELKTPLSIIQNYGILLQKSNLTDEDRIEYAKSITVASRRLSELITNILKLNKLENQQIYPKKQTYNLGEQLCECLLNFESTWEKKEININTSIEEEVFIESDIELLTLVWNNLFSNAMKFTDQGGSVSISLKSDNDFVFVQVSDTGCGISSETGKHIFDKFYQGDTSHATQGNGLGLALVKRIIDIIGGDIFVNSEVGKGSTFTVKFRKKNNE